jgi:hypothetical protein
MKKLVELYLIGYLFIINFLPSIVATNFFGNLLDVHGDNKLTNFHQNKNPLLMFSTLWNVSLNVAQPS